MSAIMQRSAIEGASSDDRVRMPTIRQAPPAANQPSQVLRGRQSWRDDTGLHTCPDGLGVVEGQNGVSELGVEDGGRRPRLRGLRTVGRLLVRAGARAWRHRRSIGTLMVLAAVFALGTWTGWWLRDRSPEAAPITVRVQRPVAAPGGGVASSGAPNLLGLDAETARRVAFDAGIASERVRTHAVPAAGQPGRVVTQEPAPGVRIAEDATLELGLAEATVVPEVVGRSRADARATIEGLGAHAAVRLQYVPGAATGSVTGTEPAAGQPLGTEVVLIIAAPPSSVFLTALSPTEGGCSNRTESISGQEFASTLACSATTSGQPRSTVYVLGRKATTFEATFGQSDRAAPGATVRVRIFVDDRVVVDESIGHGQAKPISVDVTNALRMRIEATATAPTGYTSTPTVLLGSGRLIGGPSEIEALTKERS